MPSDSLDMKRCTMFMVTASGLASFWWLTTYLCGKAWLPPKGLALLRSYLASTTPEDPSVTMEQPQTAGVNEVEVNNPRLYEIYVIPGGGVATDGYPAPWTIARCDAAALRFHSAEGRVQGYFVTLSLGTPHRPIPTRPDDPDKSVMEADAAARYLIEKHGIPPEHILEEASSLDTIGNAYWFREIHLEQLLYKFRAASEFGLSKAASDVGVDGKDGGNSNVDGIIERARGVDLKPRVIVFTSLFHMPRTKAIFEHILALPRFSDSGFEKALTVRKQSEKKDGPSVNHGSMRVNVQVPANHPLWGPSSLSSEERCKIKNAAGQISLQPDASTQFESLKGTTYPAAFDLEFVPTEDVGMAEDVLRARQEREARSLDTWLTGTRWSLRSMHDVWRFIFHEHGAYNAKRHLATKTAVSQAERATY